jgi:hypothetical protein
MLLLRWCPFKIKIKINQHGLNEPSFDPSYNSLDNTFKQRILAVLAKASQLPNYNGIISKVTNYNNYLTKLLGLVDRLLVPVDRMPILFDIVLIPVDIILVIVDMLLILVDKMLAFLGKCWY